MTTTTFLDLRPGDTVQLVNGETARVHRAPRISPHGSGDYPTVVLKDKTGRLFAVSEDDLR